MFRSPTERYNLYTVAEYPPQTFLADQLRQALHLVGSLLHERGLSYEIVVIGGSNLALQGIINRPTVDVDVVAMRTSRKKEYEAAQPLPQALLIAVEDTASLLSLPANWLNSAAASDFALGLPHGFEQRVSVERFEGLFVAFAHRQDIIAWKIQAAVDQWGTPNHHLQDLHQLKPNHKEIIAAQAWFQTVESKHSAFWINLIAVLKDLGYDE